MDLKRLTKLARELASPYCVRNGSKFRLKQVDPGDTAGYDDEDKPRAKEALAMGVEALNELQEVLYAQDQWSVLLVFQAMDAAGKDGAIKHLTTGLNPQACHVTPFKQPSSEDLDHDFLWRCAKQLPERGRIGVFNRSYYEEVLVVRVHPELLAKQKLPERLTTKDIWEERYESIRNFEEHLVKSGTLVLKFFLHVSKAEQKKRFLARLDDPHKNWKFSVADAAERRHWGEYMHAYEEMVRGTATKQAPWYVVPADNKWFTRIVVAAAVIDALASLDLKYPTLDKAKREELAAARKALE